MKRQHYELLVSRLREPRKFIQLLFGPRQVGKTTVVRQVLAEIDIPYLFLSADTVSPDDSSWISSQWQMARMIRQQQGCFLCR